MFGECTADEDKYETAKWGGFYHDSSIAKTNYHKSSTPYKSTAIRSYSPNQSLAASRLEDARKTIDIVIDELNDKRDMNNEALQEIKTANSEILDGFRRGGYYESNVKLIKDSSNFARIYKGSSVSAYDSPPPSLPKDDSLALRERLNTEIHSNNSLLLRLAKTEQENTQLKRGLQIGSAVTAETEQLRMENQRLKLQIANVVQVPKEILIQVAELKKQNKQLRGDTVRLLRRTQKY